MRYLLLFIPLSLLSSCSHRKCSDGGMEDFGKRIFQLISGDRYKEIADLMLNLSEYKELIDVSTLDKDAKEERMKALESNLKSSIESLKRSYDGLRTEAENRGIDWNKSKLVLIDFDHKRENGIESADLFLNFEYKEVKYEIEVKNCYKNNSSWSIGNYISFKNRENYFDRW
ncbi:MAG: hypothetical protein IT223_03900 [Crocinitomicaceae bacterium]|nr:hypothetical protein [Crocinitomicaceae bacterium]